MKHAAAIALAACLAATPLSAETEDDVGEGLSLMEQGARLLMHGLMREFEPALRDLAEQIDELGNYHAPEMLPNGDIILRRKQPRFDTPHDNDPPPPADDGPRIDL